MLGWVAVGLTALLALGVFAFFRVQAPAPLPMAAVPEEVQPMVAAVWHRTP